MLQFRRVLAFSSRVHTYLLMLYLFFFLMFSFTFITSVDTALLTIIKTAMTLISWSMIFFGVWIVFASIYQFFYTKVFAFAPAILTVLRCIIVLLLATGADIVETIVVEGVSLWVNRYMQ